MKRVKGVTAQVPVAESKACVVVVISIARPYCTVASFLQALVFLGANISAGLMEPDAAVIAAYSSV